MRTVQVHLDCFEDQEPKKKCLSEKYFVKLSLEIPKVHKDYMVLCRLGSVFSEDLTLENC